MSVASRWTRVPWWDVERRIGVRVDRRRRYYRRIDGTMWTWCGEAMFAAEMFGVYP